LALGKGIVLSLFFSDVLVAEVNFLCVHRNLRSKRLAPLLIKEITRRVNLDGIFQAIYTAGIKILRPISTASYYHKPLNVEKLVSCGFCSPSQVFDMSFSHASSGTLTPMKESDCVEVHAKLNEYLTGFDLFPKFSEDEFKHFFLTRHNVVYSFVKKDGNLITDFISYYSIPTSVIGREETIYAAYMFYYFSPSINELTKLVSEVLAEAKKLGFDVFNTLDIMRNNEFFQQLGFLSGDGKLNYYLYNWRTAPFSPPSNGFVLF
jgi:glycylpeptide N-tetradecanoyltransferase